MTQTFAWMTSVDWLEGIKILAPVTTAIIAFMALRNWQRQDKAKREAEFLDAIIEAAHTYISDLTTPITIVEMAKISMTSRAPTWETGDESDIAVKGAIAFIEKDGERVGKRLLEALMNARPSVVKLRSLAAKGQVFNFTDYGKCQDAVRMLTWHFDRAEGFAAYISTQYWYWANPQVREALTLVMSIDVGEMRAGVQDSHVALLEFGRATYKSIYR
jgi:hypothetical protein